VHVELKGANDMMTTEQMVIANYIRDHFEKQTGCTGNCVVTFLPQIEGIGVIVIGDDDHCHLWVQQSTSDDDEYTFHRSDDPSQMISIPLQEED
jgi:hypothetical protein